MTDHPQEGENNLLNKSLAECPKMAHKLKQEQGLQRKEGGAPPEFIQVSVQYTGHGLAVGAGRKVKGERERGGGRRSGILFAVVLRKRGGDTSFSGTPKVTEVREAV